MRSGVETLWEVGRILQLHWSEGFSQDHMLFARGPVSEKTHKKQERGNGKQQSYQRQAKKIKKQK